MAGKYNNIQKPNQCLRGSPSKFYAGRRFAAKWSQTFSYYRVLRLLFVARVAEIDSHG